MPFALLGPRTCSWLRMVPERIAWPKLNAVQK
jgi:hypothetical protein